MNKPYKGMLTVALGGALSICATGVAYSSEGESDGNRYYIVSGQKR